MSRPRIILTLGDDGIVVTPLAIPGGDPFFVAADDAEGVKEILALAARTPGARVTFLLDNLAQDYRIDDLPRLNFFDRAKLTRRRLAGAFPAARLTACRASRQRRNRQLLIGVHESNAVFAWEERWRARAPDIALLPVEGAALAARLAPPDAEWVLTISRNRSGGMRQIVTWRGELVFTRMAPLPPQGEEAAPVILRDIKASLDYLSRYGLADPRRLDLLLLMPENSSLAAGLRLLSLRSAVFLSPADAARKLALPFSCAPDDPCADLLFAASLAAKPRAALSLMLPDAADAARDKALRFWGMRIACAALAAALGQSLWAAGDLASTLWDIRHESLLRAQAQETLKEEKTKAAPLTEPLGRLRQALERRHIYDKPVTMPWDMLNRLAPFPDADGRLAKLEWKKESDFAPETAILDWQSETSVPDKVMANEIFIRKTRNLAQAFPDYVLTVLRTPYPDLPQDTVTAATPATPMGSVSLQKGMP